MKLVVADAFRDRARSRPDAIVVWHHAIFPYIEGAASFVRQASNAPVDLVAIDFTHRYIFANARAVADSMTCAETAVDETLFAAVDGSGATDITVANILDARPRRLFWAAETQVTTAAELAGFARAYACAGPVLALSRKTLVRVATVQSAKLVITTIEGNALVFLVVTHQTSAAAARNTDLVDARESSTVGGVSAVAGARAGHSRRRIDAHTKTRVVHGASAEQYQYQSKKSHRPRLAHSRAIFLVAPTQARH